MKKFIAILLASTIVLSSSATVFANELNNKSLEIINNKTNYIKTDTLQSDTQYKIFIDNKQINTQEGVISYQNEIFLPLRSFTEALGLDIKYDAVHKVVSIREGMLQLPVNYNKAVVNGNILSIDENNSNIGTILFNEKTYLPVNFISKNSGYFVEHKPETKEIYLTTIEDTQENNKEDAQQVNTLDKKQALEVYNQLMQVSSSYKNFSDSTNTVVNLHLKDSTGEQADLKMNVVSEGKYNLDGEILLYIDQKQALELDGETETINSKTIYKDGNLYIDQGELKAKTELPLDEVIEMSKNGANNITQDNFILGGTYKELQDGNKEYTFDIDLQKSNDFAKEVLSDLNSIPNELEVFESLQMNNAKLVMIVDSQNNLIKSDIEFKVSLSIEDVKAEGTIKVSSEYKDIDKTVITIKEDLTKFEEITLTE